MANITETDIWSEGVYQIEKSDPVLGGKGGIANRQAEHLAARTQWLKKQLTIMGVSTEQFEQLFDALYVGSGLDKQGEEFKDSWLLDSIELLLKPYALKTDVNGYTRLEADATFVKTNDLVGVPIPYPTNTPPNGYLAMVGQDINKEQYPILHNLYNGKLPDMRDRYVRGANGSRGGIPLTLQDDAIRNIEGVFNRTGGYGVITPPTTTKGVFKAGDDDIGWGIAASQSFKGRDLIFDASLVVPTADENRPLSITFNYICLAR